ncbi:hypothetical protein KDH_12200 [Dictyobacter sp. S3.2.2.5]|uniref:N-acetyltransferase domain-containing protein n=1 Tax=Dictyobacter halimunensis TaxID=3026934 RepID=A0ABQ6FJH6_9CHLR|nr:hypothetical protein KDH_12200 [Dictyobacter sp. S3.2.2.5]
MPRRKKLENLDEEIAKVYYTAKEAQQKLGMDRDKFNYTIKTRKIERIPFLGGYGYYRKADIDDLAEEIEAFLIAGGKARFEYKVATLETLEDEMELAALNFSRKNAEKTREMRLEFLKANPEITHYLYRDRDLVSSINFIPFTHDAILEFKQGQRGWALGSHRIMQFQSGQRLECIIIDMMTSTKVIPEQRDRYAAYLLKNFAQKTMIEWANSGVDIATVDACAGTVDGANILKQAGFEYIGKHAERDIYHLDVDESNLPLLKNYKAALSKHKQRSKKKNDDQNK